MTIFNRIAQYIRALKTPQWVKDMFAYIIDKIIFPLITRLGEEAINDLQKWVIEASRRDDLDWNGKLLYVKDKFTAEWKVKLSFTDTDIINAIQMIVSEMKSKGFIK